MAYSLHNLPQISSRIMVMNSCQNYPHHHGFCYKNDYYLSFKKNIDVMFEISIKFGEVKVQMWSKQYIFLYIRGSFLMKFDIFVHFREFLGIFADLDVDWRACRALLGEFKGGRRKIDV